MLIIGGTKIKSSNTKNLSFSLLNITKTRSLRNEKRTVRVLALSSGAKANSAYPLHCRAQIYIVANMSTVASTAVTSRLSSKVTLRDSRTRHFGVGLPRRRAGRYTATRAEVTNGNGAPVFLI